MNARMPLFLRGLAVLLFLALPTLAQAAILNVPSTNYPTIQYAIYAAHDGDTVLVADGTYTGEGNRDIDFLGKNITVKSLHGAAKTVIDCQGSASSPHRGFYIHTNEVSATIDGFTVKNGYEDIGGGIANENFIGGTITIANCIVTNNTVSQYGSGGGIANINIGGRITLTNCVVAENTSYGEGGGIYNANNLLSLSQSGVITITHCNITKNLTSGQGGGVYNTNPPQQTMSGYSNTINLNNCTIAENTAQTGGGGIYNNNVEYGTIGSAQNANFIMIDSCTISKNVVVDQNSSGGGINNSNSGTVTVTHCTVAGNTSPFGGGGLYNENLDGGLITLSNNIVTENASIYGGIENYNNTHSGSIVLTDCTVTKNTGQYNGGGVNNFNTNGSSITLTHCTVSSNTALVTGGVENFNYQGGIITLTNCTMNNNICPYGGGGVNNSNASGGTITLTGCSIQGNTANFGAVANSNAAGGAITLTNCIVAKNMSSIGGGVYIQNSHDSSIELTNCTITGNMIQSGGINGAVYIDTSSGGATTLTNDIIYADIGGEITNNVNNITNAVISNCDIQNSLGGYFGTNSIDADPQFVNATAGDVHLKPNSPCLGAGTVNGAPATDKDGQLRPYPPSIGAYELKIPPATITSFSLSSDQIDAPGALLSAFVTASGKFTKVTVSVPRGSLGIVSPTFTLTNYGGPYWYGTISTAFLKLAKTNPVTFIATGTRADGTTATLTTTLQINNRPTLSLYAFLYPDSAVVHRNDNLYFYSYVGNFTGVPALYTTVQITLPPGIDYVSSDGVFTYNAATRTLTQGFPSLIFQQFNLVLHVNSTASTQKPLTIPIVATCPGFQQAVLNSIIQVVP